MGFRHSILTAKLGIVLFSGGGDVNYSSTLFKKKKTRTCAHLASKDPIAVSGGMMSSTLDLTYCLSINFTIIYAKMLQFEPNWDLPELFSRFKTDESDALGARSVGLSEQKDSILSL